MPLLPGKRNIGRNIKTEESHGKKPAQAKAIALSVAGVHKKSASPHACIAQCLRDLQRLSRGDVRRYARDFHSLIASHPAMRRIGLTRQTLSAMPQAAVSDLAKQLGISESPDSAVNAFMSAPLPGHKPPAQERAQLRDDQDLDPTPQQAAPASPPPVMSPPATEQARTKPEQNPNKTRTSSPAPAAPGKPLPKALPVATPIATPVATPIAQQAPEDKPLYVGKTPARLHPADPVKRSDPDLSLWQRRIMTLERWHAMKVRSDREAAAKAKESIPANPVEESGGGPIEHYARVLHYARSAYHPHPALADDHRVLLNKTYGKFRRAPSRKTLGSHLSAIDEAINHLGAEGSPGTLRQQQDLVRKLHRSKTFLSSLGLAMRLERGGEVVRYADDDEKPAPSAKQRPLPSWVPRPEEGKEETTGFVPVKSSWIAGLRLTRPGGVEMAVKRGGKVYPYPGFDLKEFRNWIKAASPGKFWWAHVGYPARDMVGPAPPKGSRGKSPPKPKPKAAAKKPAPKVSIERDQRSTPPRRYAAQFLQHTSTAPFLRAILDSRYRHVEPMDLAGRTEKEDQEHQTMRVLSDHLQENEDPRWILMRSAVEKPPTTEQKRAAWPVERHHMPDGTTIERKGKFFSVFMPIKNKDSNDIAEEHGANPGNRKHFPDDEIGHVGFHASLSPEELHAFYHALPEEHQAAIFPEGPPPEPKVKKVKPQRMQRVRRYADALPNSFSQAMRALSSPNLRAFSEAIESSYKRAGIDNGKAIPVIHDSPKFSMPALLGMIQGHVDPKKALYAAAWHGLMSKQPATLAFLRGPGPDSLYSMKFPGAAGDVRGVLDQIGVQSRLIKPMGRETEVIVHDPGRQFRDRLAGLNVPMREMTGKGVVLNGREDYRDVSRQMETENAPTTSPRSAGDGASSGAGAPAGASRA